MITFKNKPKLLEHEIDKEFNQRRLTLASNLESFLAEHELFKGKDVTIEFSQEGVSSLVCFVETDSDKYVLKIPLHPTAEGEALFLKKWEEVGVVVPHVFAEGVIAGYPYILMSFIDAPLLIKTPKEFRLNDEMYIELGKTLALMHSPKAEGYGLIVKGRPQNSSFKEWVESERIKEKIEIVKAKNILNEEHGSIEKAIQILISYSEEFPVTSYCHLDFGSGNIMATKPITIIDPSPNPILNMGVLDMARTLMLMASGGSSGEEKFKEGYFSIAKPVSDKVIQAAVVLNAYLKFGYWSNKEKWEQIERVKQYLAQGKHFLDS